MHGYINSFIAMGYTQHSVYIHVYTSTLEIKHINVLIVISVRLKSIKVYYKFIGYLRFVT